MLLLLGGASSAADVTWPFTTLIPRTVKADIAGVTVSGGRSLTGRLQQVASDSGFVQISLIDIPITTIERLNAWRVIETALEGRLGTCLVPLYDSKRAPWPGGVPGASISAVADADIASGATSGSVDMIVGAAPVPGMWFSAGDRAYRIKTVLPPTGTVYPITFRPPAREAIPDGTTLEFQRPTCRCRLTSDDGMTLTLDLQKFCIASVNFEEDI